MSDQRPNAARATVLRAGSAWGIAGEELNATPVAWPAGRGTADQVAGVRELLLVVLAGAATVAVDADEHALSARDSVLIRRGARWRLTAGPEGVFYLSVHLRRGPLALEPPVSGR